MKRQHLSPEEEDLATREARAELEAGEEGILTVCLDATGLYAQFLLLHGRCAYLRALRVVR